MTISTPNSPTCSGLEYTKKHVKSLLKNYIFVGEFKEKRFVDTINAYRDIITVSPQEKDFIENLMAVKRKLALEIVYKSWIGITTPKTIGAPVGYNLWVVLPQEVFGTYWYRVKTVEFFADEIRLKLDIIRPYQRESTPLRSSDESEVNVSMIYQEKTKIIKENILYFFRHIMTLHNTKEVLIFLCVLASTLFLGFISGVKYLLEYLLLLIREISIFITSIGPLFNAMMQMITKCIFGLYHLVFMIFGKPTPVYNNYLNLNPQNEFSDPRVRYNTYFKNRALPYYPTDQRRGPTITPLD
ncbi:uncharacterized protein LOC130448057 [Diorhabda sublineata]|uniref:uncharacterized protein LOC130448057 n=1 Tax=Diorhabda sublineata TaxID=1163346 RepID=UPI0024E0F1A5|nr:uncharacterized protein LOC130448057 [Diorhabda sublineata]